MTGLLWIILTLLTITLICLMARAVWARKDASGKGALEWFELEVAPFEFKLALVPGQPILIAYRPHPKSRPAMWLIDREDNEELIVRLKNALHGLVEKYNLAQSKPESPEKVFREDVMEIPAFHVRIGRAGERGWQSWYPVEGAAHAVKAMYDECRLLCVTITATQPGQPVSEEQALRMVGPHA